jgi:hypothetical protein
MASATPAHTHSTPDRSLKDGSPDPSANPSVATADQQRRTSFNFLRRVRHPCVRRVREIYANVDCKHRRVPPKRVAPVAARRELR